MNTEKAIHQTLQLTPGIRVVPIVHGSLEYTVYLRRLILESPPKFLALELPENLSIPLEKCLPYADSIPVISMTSKNLTGLELHLILEPLEPIVEAARSAHDFGIPIHCIDLYNEYFMAWVPDSFPDTYSLETLGVKGMYEQYIKSAHYNKKTSLIKDELSVAEKSHYYASPEAALLKNLSENSGRQTESDLVLDAINTEDALFEDVIDQIDDYREIKMAMELRNLSKLTGEEENDLPEILLVCGIKHVEGIQRLLLLTDEQFEKEADRLRLLQSHIGPVHSSVSDSDEEPLEALLNRQERIASESMYSAEDFNYEISTLSGESAEVLSQPGYYNSAWILTRKHPQYVNFFNRLALQRQAYRDTVNRYEKESGEIVPPQKQKLFFQFTRNWSVIEKRLLPDMYKLVIASRSFHNDNFARIMYDMLSYMPPRKDSPFPEKQLTLDDLYKDSKLIRFRMKEKIRRRVPPPKLTKRFKREKYPGEWMEIEDRSICSFPPEDIVIEDFGRYLQNRAQTMMSGKDQKTIPFSSSLLDGIDYRETIRSHHLGKIFVKDIINRGIDAGSVVIIFSENFEEHPWEMIWWGEHSQESDMAFYATPFGQHLVGPGIYRCQYGGLLMTHPPGRIHEIWNDDYYNHFTNPADRLLAAAIEYNDKNAVVHLSNRPPAPILVSAAGRLGQKIIHIPLSSMDPVRLGRVRRFHVLDSKDRRQDAGDFVW
jgi:hypothetical protein